MSPKKPILAPKKQKQANKKPAQTYKEPEPALKKGTTAKTLSTILNREKSIDDASNTTIESYWITVLSCNNSKSNRKWDKFQYCVYCGEKKAKLARHLQSVHDKEIEVAKVTSIVIKETASEKLKKQKRMEKKRLYDLLRKRGNFNHNQMVFEAKEGDLIVEKRPSCSGMSFLDFFTMRILFCIL